VGDPIAKLRAAWGEPAVAAVAEALARSRGGRVFFDWDNTVIRGDVGDLVMLAVLAHAPIQRPRPGAWGPLTDRAEAALDAVFGDDDTIDPAHPRRDALATLLADIVWRETLPDGAPAFAPTRTRAYRGGYFAMAAIVESQPLAARRTLALEAFAQALAAPEGDVVRVGTEGAYEVERFARVRGAMVAVRMLAEAHGLETWVVSASQEDAVRAVAERVGFEPARVLGARPATSARAFSPVEGAPVMTFDEGKRAAIAHHVEGASPERALEHRPRVAIALGDSDTDHAMLEDAAELVVLVDRGQPRVTALAARREAEGRAVIRVPFARW
jgi:phosphoserine phosphatase